MQSSNNVASSIVPYPTTFIEQGCSPAGSLPQESAISPSNQTDLSNRIAAVASPLMRQAEEGAPPRVIDTTPASVAGGGAAAEEGASEAVTTYDSNGNHMIGEILRQMRADTAAYRNPENWLLLFGEMADPSRIENPNSGTTREQPYLYREVVALRALQLCKVNGILDKDPSEMPYPHLISDAWVCLTLTLEREKEKTIPILGSISQSACYVNALSVVPDNPNNWVNLSEFLEGKEKINISGRAFSKRDCLQRALEPSRVQKKYFFWGIASKSLSSISGGILERGRLCTSIVVNGVLYTPINCCLKGLEEQPNNGHIWKTLGNQLFRDETKSVVQNWKRQTVNVDGEELDCVDAYLKILGFETFNFKPDSYIAEKKNCDIGFWINLGIMLENDPTNKKRPGFEEVDPLFCYTKALTMDTKNDPLKGPAWYTLGRYLQRTSDEKKNGKRTPDETARINNEDCSAITCFVKALECGLVSSFRNNTFSCLAKEMKTRRIESVTINQQVFSYVQICNRFQEALISAPGDCVRISASGLTSQVDGIERAHTFNNTGKDLQMELNQALDELKSVLLLEEEKVEEQRTQQREREKQRAAAEAERLRISQHAARENNGTTQADDRPTARRRNLPGRDIFQAGVEQQVPSRAVNVQSGENDDPGTWCEVQGKSPVPNNTKKNKVKRKLADFLSPEPCQLHERIVRWTDPQLTEDGVRRFEDFPKNSSKVMQRYAHCAPEKIIEEVKAHCPPQGIERLIGSSAFKQKFCKELSDGTLLLRAMRGNEPVVISLAVTRGVIYHARTESLSHLEQSRSDNNMLLSDFQIDSVGGAGSGAAATPAATPPVLVGSGNILLKPVNNLKKALQRSILAHEFVIELTNCSLPSLTEEDPFSIIIIPWAHASTK